MLTVAFFFRFQVTEFCFTTGTTEEKFRSSDKICPIYKSVDMRSQIVSSAIESITAVT